MINTIILHNGNLKVKSWISKNFNNVMPNIHSEWLFNDNIYQSMDEKINLLSNESDIVTDLTSADDISLSDIIKLKKHCKFIKVLVDFNEEKLMLEPIWNQFGYEEWFLSSALRCWIADEIILFSRSFEHSDIKQSIDGKIFSQGRSGTFVLKSLLNLPFEHHCKKFKNNFPEKFFDLLKTKEISTIFRKSLLNQCLSNGMAKHLGFIMTTRKDNFNKHAEIVDKMDKFVIDTNNIEHTFNKLSTLIDILLLLKYAYNKNIKLYFLEDILKENLITDTIKNPYQYKRDVKNYNEFVIQIKEYEDFYSNILENLSNKLGVTMLIPNTQKELYDRK